MTLHPFIPPINHEKCPRVFLESYVEIQAAPRPCSLSQTLS